jgi:SOS-response transcriptional repressor LexA
MSLFGLTPRQRECLDFVETFIARNGYSPSMQEIVDALDLKSKSGAHRLIHGLRDRGHVDMLDNKARSLVIVKNGRDAQ